MKRSVFLAVFALFLSAAGLAASNDLTVVRPRLVDPRNPDVLAADQSRADSMANLIAETSSSHSGSVIPSLQPRIDTIRTLGTGCSYKNLSLNTTVSGSLGPGDCTGDTFYVDFYLFHAAAGTSVHAILSSSSLGQVFLTIQNSHDGTVLDYSYANGTTSLTYSVPATDDYFIGVSTLTGTFRTGSYTLSTSTGGSGGNCTAKPLTLNTTISGNLSPGDCTGDTFYADFYIFHAAEGTNVHITLTSSALGQVFVTVQDSQSGTVLASNFGNGTAVIDYPVPATDDYVIGVTTLTGTFTTGSYTLKTATSSPSSGASGVGINLDVVGRLSGTGGTLFRTSIDIANNTDTSTQVDGYFVANIGGHHTELTPFSITASGLVRQGAGLLGARSVFHTDDFIDDLRAMSLITQSDETSGMIGSLLVVFDSPSSGLFDHIGQGAVQARFYSSGFGGTLGVSASGHELTTTEPSSLVGIARDSRAETGTAQVYTNFFINNEGSVANDGSIVANPVTIRLTGYLNSTGARAPIQPTYTIGNFETIGVSDIFSALGVDNRTEDTVLVFVDIISGRSAISGESSTNDAETKDPSGAQLRPANWALGR